MNREQEIAQNLHQVEQEIAAALHSAGRKRSEITLIVVTKNFPASDIEILYRLGVRDFGENRDQEARSKIPLVRGEGIRWHFQGQLQRNKLASISSWADVVHSVDDVKYLAGLSNGALRKPRHASHDKPAPLTCLIQISLDPQPSPGRAGTDLPGALEIIATCERERLSGISIAGVMAVAPLESPAREAFSRLHHIYGELKAQHPALTILSAGMSGDFAAAIAEGATHLRIGSSILGSREVSQ